MVKDYKVITNTSTVISNLKKDLKKLDKNSVEAMNAIAEAGKTVAFNKAPKAPGSGRTASAIKNFKAGNGRKVATVIAGNGHPNKKWRGDSFNLTYWMHHSNKALSQHWRGGTPHFMYEAAKVIYDETGKRFNWAINAFVKGE